MKLEFIAGRRRRAATAAVSFAITAIMLAAGFMGGWPVTVMAIVPLLMGAATFFAVGMRAHMKKWYGFVIAVLFLAFISVFLLHFPVLGGEFTRKKTFLNEMLVSAAAIMLLWGITGRLKAAGIAWNFACLVYGLTNFAVYMFRGTVISIGDFAFVGTAVTVLDNYSLGFHPILIICPYLFICAAVFVIRSETGGRVGWKKRVAAVLCAALLAVGPCVDARDNKPKLWSNKGMKDNGALMELLVEFYCARVEAPEGYSAQAAEDILAGYASADAKAGETPHIIAVMVEAMSDLTVLGDFETDVPVMPFCESLRGEAIYGYASASVFGGKTANSEWEFLTGNSMAYLPSGAIPYRQYMDENPNSLLRVLKDSGYECVAMHPFHASGWGREKVYPLMGFDESYFLDDLEWGEELRGYVSDSAFVDRLIELYEGRDGEKPLFLFGITMQDHGGYVDPDFAADVHLVGMAGSYPDVEQYLSLIRLTDAALEKLVTYFRGVEEKVQIIFFGDHQPSLSGKFYAELDNVSQQDRYTVPYYIWNNYAESEGEMRPMTSINFLSAVLLEAAEMDMPPYYRFLLDMQDHVPVISSLGYMDAQGNAGEADEAEGDAAVWLNDYHTLQYANMFDAEANDALFTGAGE